MITGFPTPNADTRYSTTVVASVLGVSKKMVDRRARSLGIRTQRRGYSAAQVKRIRDYQPKQGGRRISGTPDQLRILLARM